MLAACCGDGGGEAPVPTPVPASVPTSAPTPDVEATVQTRLEEELEKAAAIEATVEAKAQVLAKAMVEATAQAVPTATPVLPTPTLTHTVTPTVTPTATPTATPTPTPFPPTPTPTRTPTPSPTPTITPIPTLVPTPTLLTKGNLIPATPSNWDSPIIVADYQIFDFYDNHRNIEVSLDDDIYISWAIKNEGPYSIDDPFFWDLYFDGVMIVRMRAVRGMSKSYIRYVHSWNGLNEMIIPEPGVHTLKLVVDPTDLVPETDESDNVYEQEFMWAPSESTLPTPTPAPVLTEGEIYQTLQDSGDTAAAIAALVRTGDYSEPEARETVNKWVHTTQLLTATPTPTGGPPVAIIIEPTATAKPSSSMIDLVPSTPPGWAYPIVATSYSGETEVGPLSVSVPTYIRYGFRNQGQDDISDEIGVISDLYLDEALVVRIYLWGGLPAGQWGVSDEWSGLYEAVNVTPGTHTLKIVLDPTDLLLETNEDNNVFEKEFTWGTGPVPP